MYDRTLHEGLQWPSPSAPSRTCRQTAFGLLPHARTSGCSSSAHWHSPHTHVSSQVAGQARLVPCCGKTSQPTGLSRSCCTPSLSGGSGRRRDRGLGPWLCSRVEDFQRQQGHTDRQHRRHDAPRRCVHGSPSSGNSLVTSHCCPPVHGHLCKACFRSTPSSPPYLIDRAIS